jgi:hypothetical protein
VELWGKGGEEVCAPLKRVRPKWPTALLVSACVEGLSILSYSSPVSLIDRYLRRKVYNTPYQKSISTIEGGLLRGCF